MKLLRRIIGKCCHVFHTSVAKLFSERGRVLTLHWVGNEVQDEETESFRISTEQCITMVEEQEYYPFGELGERAGFLCTHNR